MAVIALLIGVPLLAAVLLLVLRQEGARRAIVISSSALIALCSIAACIMYLPESRGVYFAYESELVSWICTGFSYALTMVVLVMAIKHKRPLVVVLALIQLLAYSVFEFGFAHGIEVVNGLYIDQLSLLMIGIIGIIGSGICVYALGYMQDFVAHHADQPDRRPLFFALMFLFLAAMFGIVVSNNLLWLYAGWEVTTVCSFLLIGYTQTAEALDSAFRQIWMNMLGGLAFLAALFFIVIYCQSLSLFDFVRFSVQSPVLFTLPLALLGVAGITKAAQMPFHTWLLGAMVAPTPTSALLHSSTMVKAGVFLLLKLSPAYLVNPLAGLGIIAVGGITFVMCSCIAISQSNAKRVLAYSTIANLGLIVACAGVGSAAALWAAIFLILFHAAAKSLLFLCVGTAEHHLGSRDIEDMDLLFDKMPRLNRLMMLGIMCMFIAPFGMLVAKWATLVSFIDTKLIALILILGFGSAATFMFWAKWLGKLSSHIDNLEHDQLEVGTHKSEWFALSLMAVLSVLISVTIPLVSGYLVEPYVMNWYGQINVVVGHDNLWLGAICTLVIVAVLFVNLHKPQGRQAQVYLSGVSVDNQRRVFTNSLSKPTEASVKNLYLENYFGEKRLTLPSVILSSVCLSLAVIVAALLSLGFGLWG